MILQNLYCRGTQPVPFVVEDSCTIIIPFESNEVVGRFPTSLLAGDAALRMHAWLSNFASFVNMMLAAAARTTLSSGRGVFWPPALFHIHTYT